MGRESMRRTILTCFSCRSIMPSSVPLGLFENQRYLRLVHNRPSDTVQNENKENSIRIGNKIYIVKTSQACNNSAPRRSSNKQVKNLQDKFSIVDVAFVAKPMRNNKSRNKKEKDKIFDNKISTFKVSEGNVSKNSVHNIGLSDSFIDSQSGIELSSIMKHSFYCEEDVKPFQTKFEEINISRTKRTAPIFGVRGILNLTIPPKNFQNMTSWKESNVHKFGSEGFTELVHELKQSGLDFQNMVQEYLRQGDSSLAAVSPVMEAYWESVGPALRQLKTPQCFQEKAWHRSLNYGATIDCIADYNGKPAVVEIMRSISPKMVTADRYIRIVASVGAINGDPDWPYKFKNIVVINAFADGSPAKVHELHQSEIELYWKLWLRRLHHFLKTDRPQTDNQMSTSQKDIEDNSSSEEILFTIEPTELNTKKIHIAPPDIRGESHPPEQSFQESCQAKSISQMIKDTSECVPVNNYSEPILEKKVLLPKSHVQTTKIAGNETSQKPEEEEGFLKRVWKMWK